MLLFSRNYSRNDVLAAAISFVSSIFSLQVLLICRTTIMNENNKKFMKINCRNLFLIIIKENIICWY